MTTKLEAAKTAVKAMEERIRTGKDYFYGDVPELILRSLDGRCSDLGLDIIIDYCKLYDTDRTYRFSPEGNTLATYLQNLKYHAERIVVYDTGEWENHPFYDDGVVLIEFIDAASSCVKLCANEDERTALKNKVCYYLKTLIGEYPDEKEVEKMIEHAISERVKELEKSIERIKSFTLLDSITSLRIL